MRSVIVYFLLTLTLPAFSHQYNPWYFEVECDTFKIDKDKKDKVDLYQYNPQIKAFEWIQTLSPYAQKIEYHMQDLGQHYISVTDESGHMLVYKWKNGSFYLWG